MQRNKTKSYVANRYDCVGYVLDQLGITLERINLPAGWTHNSNSLIENFVEILKEGKIKKRIEKIILNPSSLKAGDVLFLRIRGKFTHHLGLMAEDGHYWHNLPGRGVTRDFLPKKSSFFRFALRLRKD